MPHPLLPEVRAALAGAANAREPTTDTTFNKPGDEWVSYGLRAPVYYAVVREFRKRIAALPLDERFDLAAQLLAAHIGELGHAGIYVLAQSARDIEPKHFPALDRMADDFRGWSHVDDFCITVLQTVLERHPDALLKQLQRWSRSPNRWKRRTSVVAFTRKVGESALYTDFVLSLCDRLAFDPEDLVQKGAGWALKDNLRGAPDRVVAFVKELRRRGAPATVTLYAIRDLKGAARDEVRAVRPERRGGRGLGEH